MADTKVCDSCDVECGLTEEKCPKCGAEFAELDELASAVERGQKILEKRKARQNPPAPPEPPAKKTITQRLRGLGKLVR